MAVIQGISARAFRDVVIAAAVVQAVIDVASIASGAKDNSNTVAVPDAALGDIVLVSAGVDLAGLTASAYVSAAGVVRLDLANNTGGAVDLASTTFTFVILRAKQPF